MAHNERHRFSYTLPDLSCGHCVASVRDHLGDTFPHGRFLIDLRAKRLTADLPPGDQAALEAALDEIGYPGHLVVQGVSP